MTSVAKHQGPIILFDGVCNLCTGVVQFVIKRDSKHKFCFAPLQSQVAANLLNLKPNDDIPLGSMLLIENNHIYRKSTAALLITKQLNRLWPLLSVFLIVPRPLRDMIYDWFGNRRYRYFGKRKTCWIPSEDFSDRFLD